ncbi:hypothetical protein [Bradyrhizobium sp. Gha]|nr:hypothetical protein [Bradyrhizobium sp. Gha]
MWLLLNALDVERPTSSGNLGECRASPVKKALTADAGRTTG